MIPFYQNRERKDSDKEVFFMKGYVTACGYMGYVAVSYTHLDVYKRQVQKMVFNLWAARWQN